MRNFGHIVTLLYWSSGPGRPYSSPVVVLKIKDENPPGRHMGMYPTPSWIYLYLLGFHYISSLHGISVINVLFRYLLGIHYSSPIVVLKFEDLGFPRIHANLYPALLLIQIYISSSVIMNIDAHSSHLGKSVINIFFR